MYRLLVAVGWPEKARYTNRNRLRLDGSPVLTFFARGYGFFVYDPALRIVTLGSTRDEALLAMVASRGNGPSRDSRAVGAASNAKMASEGGPDRRDCALGE